jgi:hypothetical protein
MEQRYRVVVDGEVRDRRAAEDGGTVLATTVGSAECTDTEMLHAYQAQQSTVEPGLCWLKNPAAMAPGWLEKPERIAA